MAYVNIFSNPYKFTESWSAQGAVVRFGLEGGLNANVNVDENAGLESTGADVMNCTTIAKDGTTCPLIIAGITLTYTRQSQQIYPLNATESMQATKVVIKGAPQGVLSITSVYSPLASAIACFLKMASRDCVTKGNEMWMTLRPFGNIECTTDGTGTNNQSLGDGSAKDITWRISGVELNQLGLQMQSGPTTIVNMPLNFEFTDLKISDDGKFGGNLRT